MERFRTLNPNIPIEVWENPDVDFGGTSRHLQSYAQQEDWVTLFNAMALVHRATAAAVEERA